MSLFKTITGVLLAAVLAACGGGGGEARTPVTATPEVKTSTSAVASILLTAPSPLTLNSDGTSSKVLTVRALDASGGLVKDAVIGLTASGSTILDVSQVTTSSTTGLATVTLVANSTDQTSRVATVTASCLSCLASPATLQIAVNGATLTASTSGTVNSSGETALSVGGNLVTLSAVVKDSSGNVLPFNVPVTFTASDPTILGVSAGTVNTDTGFGRATVNVSGLLSGSAFIQVTALGSSVNIPFKVTGSIGSLSITGPANNSTMFTGVGGAKTISVSAPGATSLTFLSTLAGTSFAAPIYSGTPGGADFVGSSVLTATAAGTAFIDVIDDITPTPRRASLTIKVSPPTADKLLLNASQTTVGLATSTSTPTILLTVTALKTSGANDQPVANVPIVFSMSGGPGSGEYLTPAYAVTDSSGVATAQFFSGTAASIQNGIVITAQVQNNASVITGGGNGFSSPSAKLTIGGRALSVAIGQSSVIRESTDKTLYFLDHSVQVTDANNNPVANQLVTLRLRPAAFSLGSGCSVASTYCSEDLNKNGSLEVVSEDGIRVPTGVSTAGQCSTLVAAVPGTADGLLTPQNSVGGAVPATVTTDASGTASFALTYLKAYALWIVDDLSASVSVNGTESGSSTIFRLPASELDVKLPDICHIPNSPFAY